MRLARGLLGGFGLLGAASLLLIVVGTGVAASEASPTPGVGAIDPTLSSRTSLPAGAASPLPSLTPLALYRQALLRSPPPLRPVEVPTCVIVPLKDFALRPEIYDQLPEVVADLEVHSLDANHWAHHQRAAEVTAIPCRPPERTCGRALGTWSHRRSAWPPRRSVMAGPEPRYPTKFGLKPRRLPISTPQRCVFVPMPPCAMTMLAPWAFIQETKSCGPDPGIDFLPIRSSGAVLTRPIGAKAVFVS